MNPVCLDQTTRIGGLPPEDNRTHVHHSRVTVDQKKHTHPHTDTDKCHMLCANYTHAAGMCHMIYAACNAFVPQKTRMEARRSRGTFTVYGNVACTVHALSRYCACVHEYSISFTQKK